MNRIKQAGPFPCDSKVEEIVIKLHAGLPVDALTHQEGQLVGVLTGRWHPNYSLEEKKRHFKKTIPSPSEVFPV